MLAARRLRVAALAAVAGALLLPAVTLAHPLGNFTINHHSGIRVGADAVVVDHVLDLAEIPTFSAFREVDTDADGQASDAERAAAAGTRCADQASALSLTVGGAAVPLAVTGSAVSFPMGQGAPTMRLVCRLEAAVAAGVVGDVTFSDPTYAERAGWREITVEGDGMTVSGSVTAESQSDRLTAYPTGLLAQAPTVASVAFSVVAGGPTLAPLVQPELAAVPSSAGSGETAGVPSGGETAGVPSGGETAGVPSGGETAGVPGGAETAGNGETVSVPGGIGGELSGDLAAIFQADELTPVVLVLSMLAAAGLGALHALSPGHGKTVMAAYLVGSRGSARQALGLGATVTVSHTLGVLVLGAVSLSASAIIAPERLYPILGVVSGAIVIVIAGWLLLGIARGWRSTRADARAHAAAHAAGSAHDHGHAHAAVPETAHAHGAEAHDHPHPHTAVHAAQAHDAHGSDEHDHPHAAVHTAQAHDHPHAHDDHGHDHAAPAPAAAAPRHEPDADGYHSHGGLRHTHVLPAGQPLRWRALFALGLAGGMVPSVSAIILLLGSIAAGRPAYGIALTIAFGVGMAAVLVGIGMSLVYARGLVDRLPARTPVRSLGRLVPAGSAAVMLFAGVLITAQAASTFR